MSKSLRKSEEFEEEDVWGSFKGEDDSSSFMHKVRKAKNFSTSSSSSSSTHRKLQSGGRMIPRGNNNRTHEANQMGHDHQQSSAPVSIPDWSKIYRKPSTNGVTYHDHDHDHDLDDHVVNDEDDDCDDDGQIVPPHEWIARKLARSQISSFSVCEGMGRTLKGRDLSKVRNAVLSKTGFLE